MTIQVDVNSSGTVSSEVISHEPDNCGKSGVVLCRYSALSVLQPFDRRFVHMAECGGFLCISKTSSSMDDSGEEDLMSCLWSRPFCQIQISNEDIESISEYTGVTFGVLKEYCYGLQGEGRVNIGSSDSSSTTNACLSQSISTSSLSSGVSGHTTTCTTTSTNISSVTCSSSTSSSASTVKRGVSVQEWTLLFTSAAERDTWKDVLVRGLAHRSQQKNQALKGLCSGRISPEDRALEELVLKMHGALTLTDRFVNNVKYFKCFVGGEAIAFLMKTLRCSEKAALRTALRMTTLGWVRHVTYEHFLRNELMFYQFSERVAALALNATLPEVKQPTPPGSKAGILDRAATFGGDVLLPLPPFLVAGVGDAVRGVMGVCAKEAAAAVEANLQSQVEGLQEQARRDRQQILVLEEVKEDLEEAVKDVSLQATAEIALMRSKMRLLVQWLSVLLATTLCHCVTFLITLYLHGTSLIITSSYIVDTLIYILNLAILEHFFQLPSYYLLLYIDPDSAHAPFSALIDKDSGTLAVHSGDDDTRDWSDSENSSSSTSSLAVALSVQDDGEFEDVDEAMQGGSSPLRLHAKRFRSWSVESGACMRSRNVPRRMSCDSDCGGSDSNSIRDTPVPVRYIRGCGGDLEEAEHRWAQTLEWRRTNAIDRILKEPHQQFQIIKELCPHFIHGKSARDADGSGAGGYPVHYQQLYKIDFAGLKSRKVTRQDLLRHALFIKEYIFTHVEPNDDEGQVITVLDVKGMGLAEVGGEALDLWKAHSKVLQSHYLERSHQIFVINASSMFRVVWKLVKPMLGKMTRKKVKIFRQGADMSKLVRCIGVSNLPREYGGIGAALSLGASEEERLLAAFVTRLNGVAVPPAESGE